MLTGFSGLCHKNYGLIFYGSNKLLENLGLEFDILYPIALGFSSTSTN